MGPRSTFSITFQSLAAEHAPLLARWLATPHVREWWGDPAEQLALVLGDINEPLMQGYLFLADGTPAGYIQAYPAEAWPGHPFGPLAAGAQAVDLFLGDIALLGQGVGSLALTAFADRLLAEGASRVLIDPDPSNLRAVRAYQKAGFRTVGVGEGLEGPALIMVRDRDEDQGRQFETVSPASATSLNSR